MRTLAILSVLGLCAAAPAGGENEKLRLFFGQQTEEGFILFGIYPIDHEYDEQEAADVCAVAYGIADCPVAITDVSEAETLDDGWRATVQVPAQCDKKELRLIFRLELGADGRIRKSTFQGVLHKDRERNQDRRIELPSGSQVKLMYFRLDERVEKRGRKEVRKHYTAPVFPGDAFAWPADKAALKLHEIEIPADGSKYEAWVVSGSRTGGYITKSKFKLN